MRYWFLILTAMYLAVPVAILEMETKEDDKFTRFQYAVTVILWGPLMLWVILNLSWQGLRGWYRDR